MNVLFNHILSILYKVHSFGYTNSKNNPLMTKGVVTIMKKENKQALIRKERLSELRKYISDGKWGGMAKLMKDNRSLADYLYRHGVEKLFNEINLNYDDYKPTSTERYKRKVLDDFKKYVNDGHWENFSKLKRDSKTLYHQMQNIGGIRVAYECMGLNYDKLREESVLQREEEILSELKAYMDNNQWEGISHLRSINNSLYKRLDKIGIEKAFEKLGLDYDNYKYLKQRGKLQ